MIVWLNGPFGVGKTTTGRRLVERETRLRFFDPEWVGSLVAHHLADREMTDFRHHESWRVLTPVVGTELIRVTGQDLVAVQSVLEEEYWDELAAGFAERGHQILHVALEADETALRARVEADEVEVTARSWRLDHIEAWAAARAWVERRADLVVDTSELGPDQVAEVVLAARADLTPSAE